MKKSAILLAAILFLAIRPANALYEVLDHGAWPKSWPAELEPLRKQSRTHVGPKAAHSHYQIPFTKREEFEAAWPHLLKVKSKGAPIILVRGPKTDFFEIKPAGVLTHSPPAGQDKKVHPEEPLNSASLGERWMWTTYIELVVDGDIVDLNRISLPPNTLIIDKRFDEAEKKPVKASGK